MAPKQKICRKWRLGHCKNGELYNFAHEEHSAKVAVPKSNGSKSLSILWHESIFLSRRSWPPLMRDVTPQLWFSQTENLMCGYHVEGKFNEVRHVEMGPKLAEWETAHQTEIKKLVSLMNGIKQVAMGAQKGKCTIIYASTKKPHKLKICETNGNNFVVSKEMREIFCVKNAARE